MRLIDADALIDYIIAEWQNNVYTNSEMIDIRLLLKHTPTVGAVPVIRCKECCWYTRRRLKPNGEEDKRYKPTWCELWRAEMPETGYCHRGEKNEHTE